MTRRSFGSIRNRGRNVWQIRWRDAAGNPKSDTVHGNKRDAEEKLARIQAGLEGSSSSMRWSEYWEAMVDPTLDGLVLKTAHEYRRLWRSTVEPLIGRVRIKDTDWRVADSALSSIKAPSTNDHALALMRKVFNMAVRDGLLARNPIDRTTKRAKRKKVEKVCLDAPDVPSWMAAIEGIKYEPVLLAMAGAGLRVEEACALDWEDVELVDLDGSARLVVTIGRTIVTVGGTSHERDGVKTFDSWRKAMVCEPFASRLWELRGQGHMVGSGERRTAPATITNNYREWCGRHGIEYVRPKDLRGSYSTWAGEAGAPDSLVRMQMGHNDGTTKGKHYQQLTLRGLSLVADMVSGYLLSFAGKVDGRSTEDEVREDVDELRTS